MIEIILKTLTIYTHLRLIENVHRDFYKLGKDSIKRVEHYDKLAEEYLFEMGTDIPDFYYNIAEAVRMTPDFYLTLISFILTMLHLKT